jgi:hypothetical protein
MTKETKMRITRHLKKIRWGKIAKDFGVTQPALCNVLRGHQHTLNGQTKDEWIERLCIYLDVR